jgi:hypothetical protein
MSYAITSNQEEAGSHRYSVGTDTPRFFATALTRTQPAKSFLVTVIFRWRSLSCGESRHLQTSPSPLHRQRPLHLCQTSHHMKKEPPRSHTGIYLYSEAFRHSCPRQTASSKSGSFSKLPATFSHQGDPVSG